MAPCLRQWNLLTLGTKVTFYRQRCIDLSKLFSANGELCYCDNIPGLFESVGIEYDPDHWRLLVQFQGKHESCAYPQWKYFTISASGIFNRSEGELSYVAAYIGEIKLQHQQMVDLRRYESRCYLDRVTSWIHKVLLFLVLVGLQSMRRTLQKETLTLENRN